MKFSTCFSPVLHTKSDDWFLCVMRNPKRDPEKHRAQEIKLGQRVHTKRNPEI